MVRVGLIGIGKMGLSHCAILSAHPEVEVIAICDSATYLTSELKKHLAALEGRAELIGIHDGARPLVPVRLIETLFEVAARTGGAVPVLDPDAPVVSRKTFRLVDAVGVVQTPQVFAGGALMAAYVLAAQADYEGDDTADVVMRFSDIEIAAVAGDPGNVKVTHPGDVEAVRSRIEASSRIGPA